MVYTAMSFRCRTLLALTVSLAIDEKVIYVIVISSQTQLFIGTERRSWASFVAHHCRLL